MKKKTKKLEFRDLSIEEFVKELRKKMPEYKKTLEDLEKAKRISSETMDAIITI